MTDSSKKEAARTRIRKLILLQKCLFDSFGEDNYNVFVFGSYPTVNFIEEESDVDVAVYTPDFDLYKKISLMIEDFFMFRGIPVDIFYVDISVVAPIYLAPLKSKLQFTDYYPEELSKFAEKCENKLNQIKMSLYCRSLRCRNGITG